MGSIENQISHCLRVIEQNKISIRQIEENSGMKPVKCNLFKKITLIRVPMPS